MPASLLSEIESYLSAERLGGLARGLVLVILGIVVARVAAAGLFRLVAARLDESQAILIRRVAYYGTLSLFLAAGLHQVGFNLNVLLGAAGILTVALGFASQTSASNIVSGLFLIAERPFDIGEIIQVGDVTGEVLSIDFLSVKVRTFDNLFVRLPNETVIKSQVKTLTRFPIRRIDLQIGVAYKEDLEKVRRVLLAVADANPSSLEEPKPLLILQGFGDSAVNLQFSVWARREVFLEVKNSLIEEVKRSFEHSGIEIPFPHRTLYSGPATEPLPIRLVRPARAEALPAACS